MQITDIRSPNLSRSLRLSKPARRGKGGIVTAQNRQAAHIGAEILRAGGSAVDAAIATSFAVGVLEPWMSGIGGVGALLVRPAGGSVTSFDAGARSPAKLDPADFPLTEGKDADLFGWPNVLEDRNVIGAKSICVPGLLRGLEAAHGRFGRLPWAALVEPAVALAEKGPVVDAATTLWIAQDMARLRRNTACAAWFLPGGLPPAAPAAVTGRVLRLPNKALAATLRQIAAEGPGALYTGGLAQALAEDVRELGGYLGTEDLAGFTAIEAEATREAFRGHTVHLVPDLNGGITVAMALRLLNAFPPATGAQAVLASAQAMAKAWEHRFSHLGDGAERTLPSCTTHISVIDRDGMAVTQTQTLLSLFGSGVVSPRTGILLNNGMNWFDPRPGRINAIAPARKALANYAPMMMTGPGEDVIAIGGSGGRKILPAIYQALIHVAEGKQDLEQAISAPRYDLSAPPTLVADARLDAETLAQLARHFPLVLSERQEHPNSFTTLGAVRRRDGINEGMTEPWHSWADAVEEGEDLLP
ncbi:gamma-glutamyltransferase family protein [Acidocella sp.]|uniref:gamma-glutamyltransferase family protein n=1 Tax=Acidocella sp. TaxID=50710 RepID=UPI003D076EA3